MRTIKFRVWDGKQMILSNEIASFNTNDNGEICAITIFSKYGDDATFEDLVLMQFTGLLDKHGKEIWEGDVVNSHAHLDEPYYRKVVWNNCGLEFDPLTGFTLCKENENHFEIVGNLYENSELLK